MGNQKNISKLLFFFTSILCTQFCIQGNSPYEKKLINKHKVPEWMADILSQHTNFLLEVNKCADDHDIETCKHKNGSQVWQLKALPGYFIKRGIGRIKGMKKISKCIKKYNLTQLDVARKYLYHISGKGYELTDQNYLVISEEQNPSKFHIDLDTIKQLCILIKKTGYFDCTKGNIILRDRDQRMVFIDTEERFFFKKNTDGRFLNDELYKGFQIILSSGGYNLNKHFTESSLRHLFSELLSCLPRDKNNYHKLYTRITTNFKENYQGKNSWNFVTHFYETFPKPD